MQGLDTAIKTNKLIFVSLLISWFTAVCIVYSASLWAQQPEISSQLRILTSNSAGQTGLIQELVRRYQQINPETNISLFQDGSVNVINRARAGEADFIITHHPEGEQFLLDSGITVQRTLIMYNTFVIFGPVSDPLRLSTKPDIGSVLHTLADNEVDMMLPSKRGGTYKKLDALWQRAGITPDWVGYEITETSNASTLRMADLMNAYTFVDIGTYITVREDLSGAGSVLFRDDAALRNYYTGNIVNSKKIMGANEAEARKFMAFLVSDKTQDFISDFSMKKFGADIFTPVAHLDPGLRSSRLEEEVELKSESYTRLLYFVIAVSSLLIAVLVLSFCLYISSRARKISEQRFSLAVEGSNDGIWDWDINNNKFYISDRALDILNLNRIKTHYLNLAEVLSLVADKDDEKTILSKLQKYISDGEDDKRLQIQFDLAKDNAEKCWVLLRGKKTTDQEGATLRISGSLTDITDRVKKNEWEQKALHDGLTGLGNRLLLANHGNEAVHKSKMRGTSFALLMLDLTKFKTINDSLGHDFGDALLIRVARRLESVIRQSDTIARLGGDEFVLLLQGVDIDRAVDIAEKIMAALGRPFKINDQDISVGGNMGIAVYPQHSESFDDLMKMADQAMYQAKRNREKYAVFVPE